ncbi:RadC family protein [Parvularcula dongshanensis]|uniref:DNA repair protein RadC n=1 Tax=Parvularcula dongshanensis TaxID=1173995 RepID=A0A840I2L5_9PROT|nr:DNA repair protein RadC [Parvularcula dongshanensis]
MPNPNAGHRKRLRERFRRAGSEGLQDYELLELILFNAIPQRDVKPLAKALIATFGSFADALAAPRGRLCELTVPVEGKPPLKMTDRACDEFALTRAAALQMMQDNVLKRPVLSSWQDLLSYCRSHLAYNTTEEFHVLFLDAKNRLITDEAQSKGTVNHTPVYPREVVKRALALDAAALILVHNHPSGDPTPSRADIEVTKRIVDAAKSVDVRVHDHLIIGRGREVSFKSLGLL